MGENIGKMIEAVGGYFELELRSGKHYHEDALRLNTARNCFEYVLLARKYKKVYIPFYTCDVMLQPLHKHNIEYEFYSVNENLELDMTIDVLPDEALLYTNYFGVKQSYVRYLSSVYKSRLIVDNAQAFFAPRIPGIDTFYSARKFFGVPDGGYLYTDCHLENEFPRDESYLRCSHLLKRIDNGVESGYPLFRQSEASLDNSPILEMSRLTSALLSNIDYDAVKRRRTSNFWVLHECLKDTNSLHLELSHEDVPMVYPYYCKLYGESLKDRLINNKIYVASYWTNVLKKCSHSSCEYDMACNVVCLPIDQRYDNADMNRIIEILK